MSELAVPARVPLLCAGHGLPFAYLQGKLLVIKSRHHGEICVNALDSQFIYSLPRREQAPMNVAIYQEEDPDPIWKGDIDSVPAVGSRLMLTIDIGGAPSRYEGEITDVEHEILVDHQNVVSTLRITGKFKMSHP